MSTEILAMVVQVMVFVFKYVFDHCLFRITPVQGKCQCFTDLERGFWEGTYCERQNECDLDSHCGTGGVCVDTKVQFCRQFYAKFSQQATTPPRKQCYCKSGWFGKETQPWLAYSRLSVRQCAERSSLDMDDIEQWNEQYPNRRASPQSGAFELFYKVDQEKRSVEYAIKARTESWIGVGIRPVSTSTTPLDASVEASSEGEPLSEGEPSSEATSEAEATSEGEPSSNTNSCDEVTSN